MWFDSENMFSNASAGEEVQHDICPHKSNKINFGRDLTLIKQ